MRSFKLVVVNNQQTPLIPDSLTHSDMESKTIEETLLEQDIGGNKRQGKRKNALNVHNNKKLKIDTTQYDDDSSSEEEEDEEHETDVNNDSKKEDKEDSDSDMFSDDEKEQPEKELSQSKKNKHKGPQTLTKAQIEEELGLDETELSNQQQFSSDNDGDDSNEPKIEAFNVDEEMSRGHFDVNGNYVQTQQDSDDETNGQIGSNTAQDQDQWYKDVNKEDIARAKQAQLDRQSQLKKKSQTQAQFSTEELLSALITILNPTETPMDAMKRLNKGKPSTLKSKKATEEQKVKERERSAQVMRITELSEGLLTKGISDVYDLEREELMGLYQRESGEKWKNASIKQDSDDTKESARTEETNEDIRKWQFRWEGDGAINGPYTNTEMNYWKENYFQSRVQVRMITEMEWIHVDQLEKFT
ncbi:hypothetical protein WICPIJ_008924 [Wickerhamomyces pijperi]|uniref:GYF domain-containing protein n=1 Tax=Wickerhamomyces pijperi TaxID=599730 RepID=A0A9P8TGN1_WICPI|nr:hypothetical protein WICPIJ_008924 [Wickerhamomyces pijperi]